MTYGDMVYDMLNRMKPGERREITATVRTENIEVFCGYVREYIETHPEGYLIEFSNDYKYIRKCSNKF